MDQPKYKLGVLSFKKLLHQMNTRNKKENINQENYYNLLNDEILSTNILERDSTRRIKNGKR